MRKRKFGRLAAWLLPLALAALLTCMPNAGMRAGAVEWTGIYSYAQLEAALSDQSGANYVRLMKNIDTGELNSGMGILASLEVRGRKQLDLNGFTLRMYSAKTAMSDMFMIRHGDLTVLDSTGGGKGTILGSTYNDSCYLFNIQSFGQFTLNSGTLKVDAGSLTNETGWKRVIYCYAGGTVTINGGTLHVAPETYEGKNNAYGQYFEEPYRDLLNGHCGYTLMAANSCKVSINGGTFEGPVRLDAGDDEWKQNVPRVWISGGIFEKKVMLNGPGDGTRPLTVIRGGVFLDYVQAWAAASFAEENPFTAAEVTVNGGEFYDTFWIRPTFPSSDIVSGGERRGYHLSAKLMNATIYKCLTADPDVFDLYKVYVNGKRDSSQKTEEDIYQLACEVLGRSAVKNGNGVFPVLNKKNYRSIFSYRNTGNPQTEGYIFEFRAFNQKPTTFYNQAWGFQKAELDGSEITMASLRDGANFISGNVPSYTVNTSGMRYFDFYWYELPQEMKDLGYRCEARCEVGGIAVTLSKTPNPATGITKGRYIIPNSTPHHKGAGTHLSGAAGVVQRLNMGVGRLQPLCRHVPAQIQCGEGLLHPHRNGAAGHGQRRSAGDRSRHRKPHQKERNGCAVRKGGQPDRLGGQRPLPQQNGDAGGAVGLPFYKRYQVYREEHGLGHGDISLCRKRRKNLQRRHRGAGVYAADRSARQAERLLYGPADGRGLHHRRFARRLHL